LADYDCIVITISIGSGYTIILYSFESCEYEEEEEIGIEALLAA
jgi:hypothetical protein